MESHIEDTKLNARGLTLDQCKKLWEFMQGLMNGKQGSTLPENNLIDLPQVNSLTA